MTVRPWAPVTVVDAAAAAFEIVLAGGVRLARTFERREYGSGFLFSPARTGER
jgi:hypothetical protein